MKLCVVAGEASGDLHGAYVLHELKKIVPGVEAFGFGGDRLAAEGLRVLHHVSELGIVGLFNVLRHLPFFRRVFAELLEAIDREKPAAVLLVDYPDFNLRVARECRKRGIPVIYYISPQVWAWRQGRVHEIARRVDHMIVIFPFEEVFYRRHDVPVTYVGHPLVEQLSDVARHDSAPVAGEPLRVALLPGSRRMEVASLLPAMADGVEILRRTRPVEAWIVKAPTISNEEIDRALAGRRIDCDSGDSRASIARAHIALSSSGTATLECAILGVPPVVMYRLSASTYWLARKLVKVPHFSLVNIVAGRQVVPELLQTDVNGRRIAEEAARLAEPAQYERAIRGLDEVRAKLGEPGAARRAAEKVATLLALPPAQSR